MNTPDDATLNTHSTADHELKIGRAGKHGAGIARNMKGDDYDLNKDQRLMRDVAAATTGLKDRGLARAGRDLLLEGNFLRNAIQARRPASLVLFRVAAATRRRGAAAPRR